MQVAVDHAGLRVAAHDRAAGGVGALVEAGVVGRPDLLGVHGVARRVHRYGNFGGFVGHVLRHADVVVVPVEGYP
ncbi:hypothetical protein D3C79_1037980 [compost metagenome]